MQDVLEDRGGHPEKMVLHPGFKVGLEEVHLVHAAQEGGLEGIRIGTGNPETDLHAIRGGIEELQIRVRSHHLVPGLHHRGILVIRIHLPHDSEAGAVFGAGRLEDLPAEPERHIRVIPDLEFVEAHQGEEGEGVLGVVDIHGMSIIKHNKGNHTERTLSSHTIGARFVLP